MKLTVSKREMATKGAVKAIRRAGDIPAVIYGLGQPVEKIIVNGSEFQAVLRNVLPGQLATTVFDIHLDGKSRKAVIKDIHYHVVGYNVEHIDFVCVAPDKKVTLNVPIRIEGEAECPGIKLGGTLRQVIRTLKVSCFPKDIPNAFTIDISTMNIAESKRLSDITIAENVRPLVPLDEVAIVIAKAKVS